MPLRAASLVNLVNAIVPLYLCTVFGFVATKLRILPYAPNYVGIGSFTSKFAFPFLLFQLVAANDPYAMNFKLIAADCLFHIGLLAALGVICFFRPTHQYLAWACTLYSLVGIPNAVLLGPPLLIALYPGTASLITTLIFMQSCIWFTVLIFLLEIQKAVYENSNDFEQDQVLRSLDRDIEGKKRSSRVEKHTKTQTDDVIPDQPGVSLPVLSPGKSQELAGGLAINIPADSTTESQGPKTKSAKKSAVVVTPVKLTKRQIWTKITKTVFYQFIWAPFVWANILGIVYASFNFRYNHGKTQPIILRTLVDRLANGAIGLAMFLLGMNMGVSTELFAGGVLKALSGAGVRFLVAPACMAVISFAVGLRGDVFRFAVMQSMLPQSILTFVFHSLYNVHLDFFSTAVWFQTATFLPFAFAIEMLLSLGS